MSSSTSIDTVRSCAAASPTALATRAGGILPCGLLPPLFLGSSSSKVLDSFRLTPSPLVSSAAGVFLLRDPPSFYCVECVVKERLMSQELEKKVEKKRRPLRGLDVDIEALVVSGGGGEGRVCPGDDGLSRCKRRFYCGLSCLGRLLLRRACCNRCRMGLNTGSGGEVCYLLVS